ncbi:hypothetical protein [Micromonospora sp. NPDC126480]|uniref:hypothetical protein n=1 Tax=Micromonospora sp. NPDC126480 TaxID=3155312 RepID=UPI003323BF74
MAPKLRFAGALVGLVLVAGCGGAGPSDVEVGTSGQLTPSSASAFPNQGELEQIAAEVSKLGQGELASLYAGVAIDVQDDRVDVWAKDPTRFEAAIDAMPWRQRIRLHPAAHAAAELEPTFQRILQDQDHWRTQGLPVVQSGVRHDGSCIEVGTPDPQRAEREFRQRYPGVPMCFSAQADTGNPWEEDRAG